MKKILAYAAVPCLVLFRGRKACEFGNLKLVSATSTKKDTYSMKIDSYDGDEVLVRDDVKYKREDLAYYKDPDGILPDPNYNEDEIYVNKAVKEGENYNGEDYE
ncbi:hypothetical protein [Priestia megaterium]|uniref:hypothetical protein n=1 Tax=Priestia megaterium TaxID=1404 RepID=UPI0011527501